MHPELAVVLILLAATVAMFALGRPRMDAVAILMMTALPLTGVITVSEAIAALSDPNIVLIGALFVIGEGLVRTGVAQRIGDFLARRAKHSEVRLIALLMAAVAGVGSFMSSTGVVAVFVPVALRIARKSGFAPGRLMMPLSVAGLISGMMTLIATPPNLIVHSQLVRAGHEGFGFFTFTLFGLPGLLVAIAYMLVVRHTLGPGSQGAGVDDFPGRSASRLSKVERGRAGGSAVGLSQAERVQAGGSAAGRSAAGRRVLRWIAEYGIEGRVRRARLEEGAPWAGKRLDELDLRSRLGVDILAIERRGRFSSQILEPSAKEELKAGDVVFFYLRGEGGDVDERGDGGEFCRRLGLVELPLDADYFTDASQAVGMVELLVPPDSGLIGETVISSRFRTRHKLTVIGIRRGGGPVARGVRDEPIRLGDTLLAAGPWRAVKRLAGEPGELIVLHVPAELDDVVPLPSRAPAAVLVLALVVLMMVSGIVPNVQAALIGCLLLGAFRCIDMNAAYRSIRWQTLFLIAGMMPFALALERTGGVDLAARALLGVVGAMGPTGSLVAVYAVTVIFGLFISNTATAVLMAPVALAMSSELGVSPIPFAMIVALASSTSFITPVSSPVNALVVGPGAYRFSDFVRVGLPLALILMAVNVLLARTLLPW